jgi:predicted PurR-regulated permease PerM
LNKVETIEVKKYDLDRVVRMVLTGVTVAVIIFIIDYLSPVLLPFVVGFIFAYMLNPFVGWVQRVTHLKNRTLAVVLALLLVIASWVLVGWLLIPYIADEIASMTKMLAAYAKTSIKIPYIPQEVQEFIRKYTDVQQLSTMLTKEQWMKLINQVATGTWSFVGGTMSVIMSIASWLIVLLYMFFILLDFDNLAKSLKGSIPKKYRRTSFTIINDVQGTMSRYFRGQALVSFFVGVIFAIEFYIIGLPMAIVFGLFIGVLNMIPYLQLLSIPIAAFLCLVASVATGGSFWVLFAWTIGAYCLCQLIQDMVLIPAIMKQQMGLNPAVIFLALSLWAYVLGIIGLLIALPLTTLIISYYCEYVLHQPNPLHRPKLKKEKK